MKGVKAAAEVQALPCVMLRQEVRLRLEQEGVSGRRQHSSPGPLASQVGLLGPVFPSSIPGKGKTLVGGRSRQSEGK